MKVDTNLRQLTVKFDTNLTQLTVDGCEAYNGGQGQEFDDPKCEHHKRPCSQVPAHKHTHTHTEREREREREIERERERERACARERER